MNAKERYLSVFDDDNEKKLDHVPTFIQYIRTDIDTHHDIHRESIIHMH